ncbi:hypothetical protein Agub_g10398, partial [Astrephomene gubernaculifera]
MEAFVHRGWLGCGSYGDVQLCQINSHAAAMLLGENCSSVAGNAPVDRSSRQSPCNSTLVALKTLRNAHKDHKVMRIALREVQVLGSLDHPNVIKLRSAFRSPSGRVSMVFDYGGKSAQQLLESRFPNGVPQPLHKRLAFQLTQALRYLHARQVVHRDVKPANILIDSAGTLRLCDFGFARYTMMASSPSSQQAPTDPRVAEPLTPYVITRWYRAPEVLLGMSYGSAVDIWSLGCTLAELATGRPLLPGSSSLDQLARVEELLGPLPYDMVVRHGRTRQQQQLQQLRKMQQPLQPQPLQQQQRVQKGDGGDDGFERCG